MAQQRVLLPLEVKAGYLEARKLAKEGGGKLPSNVLHDKYLMGSDKQRAIAGYGPPTWAREILVYPEKGGIFAEGKDIVNIFTGWVLPASYVPKQAVGVTGIMLFVDPEDITEENGKRIVHPAGSVIVLSPSIQENEKSGKVDKATGIPLAVEPESDADRRWLWRTTRGIEVSPLVRGDFVGYNSRQVVVANQRPDRGFDVAMEISAEDAKEIEGDLKLTIDLLGKCGKRISGINGIMDSLIARTRDFSERISREATRPEKE